MTTTLTVGASLDYGWTHYTGNSQTRHDHLHAATRTR